ncbi:hypothetical protein ACIQM4_33795 [Streptomyces sp. NPDC091272]|uniref:hypothetical protein n=1 Tax=Streptomyces sp. NPDC091272 TaxID=3365981 RepID=UPI0037FEA9AF
MVSTSGRGAWGGRLLLFAALLLGIVTMHTLGHPAGQHGEHGTASPSSVGTTIPISTKVTMTAPDAPHTTPIDTPHHPAASPTSASTPPSPLPGMDPMSVCLAVLAAWGVVLFGAGLLAGGPSAWTVPPRSSGPASALRPRPPPRKAVLASLSVLRI